MATDPWSDARKAWERLRRAPGSAADALKALSDIGVVRRLLDEAELQAVQVARRERRSWAEIATRLGVTRQSAWERWRDVDDEPAVATAFDPESEVYLSDGPPVRVPDVVGMSWPVAQHRLHEERLIAQNIDEGALFLGPESSDFEVIKQEPVAGGWATQGSRVLLWTHRGPGSANVRAPLEPPPDPRARRGAVDELTGESVS